MNILEAKELKCACVYRLNFPNGKSYIGKTKCLSGRIGLYERFYNGEKNGKVSEAIKEFGLESVSVDILSNLVGVKKEDLELVLSILEIKYIRDCDTIYPKGYNVSIGGEILGFPIDVIPTDINGRKSILLYDTDGNFVKEYDSIGKAAYDLGLKDTEITSVLGKRKALLGKYIFREHKYNYIPQKIDTTNIKVVERVKYKTSIVEKFVEKEINIGRPCKTLLYDENGDFRGEFDSKIQASRTFSKSRNIPYGYYCDGYIMYKKVSDDYPKKIEPYVETLDFSLGDVYKPISECKKLEKKVTQKEKLKKERHGWGKHVNLINDFKIRQFDDEGFEQIYDNIRDASESTGIAYANIWACVFGKTRTSGGFYWEKIED